MARKKAVKRADSSGGACGAPAATGDSGGYTGQLHTVTLQPGGSATCNPVEVGPGYASKPFSVEHFHAECQEVLLQLTAHLGSVDDVSAADLDVADLRLTSLDDELAAARAEAATPAAEHDDADIAAPSHAAPANTAAEVASTTAGASTIAANAGAAGQAPDGAATKTVGEDGSAAALTSPASATANTAAAGAASAVVDASESATCIDAADKSEAGVRTAELGSPVRRGRKSKRAQLPVISVISSPLRRSGRNRQPSHEAAGTADQPLAADQMQAAGERAPDQPPAAVPAEPSGQDTQQLGQEAKEDAADADMLPQQQQPQQQQQLSARKSPKRRLGVRDMGVKFHPRVELELVERVKRRRTERRDAAQQALRCLQASGAAAADSGAPDPKPRRSTNYAPPTSSGAVADAASGPAANAAAPADAALAGAAGGACAGRAAASGERVDAPEVVLTVALAHPANAQQMSQQWRVLGSQRLTVLRDRLYCRSDLDMRGAGLSVPSGMLYIEGTFYNDMRATSAVDYSYPIRAFCHTHRQAPPPRPANPAEAPAGRLDPLSAGGRDVAEQPTAPAAADSDAGAYECADMAHTAFRQLWLRLGAGAGYVYCHQGCCEHLLTFSDVRLLHPDDPQHTSAYPELVYQKHSRKRRCEVCERAPAVKVTHDDAFAPGSPAFWCLDCFNCMHYDEQRKLVSSDFKVFDYVHD